MGSCFSSASSSSDSAGIRTAKVIGLDGSLNEYPVPVTASSVLEACPSSCSLCDSDSLYYDSYISALGPKALLESERIYFVLPLAMLDYPLSGSDMAALAVKASTALAGVSSKRSKRGKVKIELAEEISERDGGVERFNEFSIAKNSKIGTGKGRVVPRSRSRARLSTIQEEGE